MEVEKKKKIIISIEGCDGVGKTTQVNLLFEKLRKQYKVKLLKFPSENFHLIEKRLEGCKKEGTKFDPFLQAIMHLEDIKKERENANEEGYQVLICDRSSLSTLIYQGLEKTKIINNDKELKDVIEFINFLYHPKGEEESFIYKYFNIVLTASPKILIENLKKRNEKKEIKEIIDEEMILKINNEYEKTESVVILKCDDGKKMYDEETINNKIIQNLNYKNQKSTEFLKDNIKKNEERIEELEKETKRETDKYKEEIKSLNDNLKYKLKIMKKEIEEEIELINKIEKNNKTKLFDCLNEIKNEDEYEKRMEIINKKLVL